MSGPASLPGLDEESRDRAAPVSATPLRTAVTTTDAPTGVVPRPRRARGDRASRPPAAVPPAAAGPSPGRPTAPAPPTAPAGPAAPPGSGRVRPLVGQGFALVREAVHLTGDLTKVVRGTGEIGPALDDRRFADPAWRVHPVYRRVAQGYTAGADSLRRLVDEFEASGADWREVERMRFLANVSVTVLAPTNMLIGNPAALRKAARTGGRSLLAGTANLVHDVVRNGGMPTQTDRNAFRVGEDLALTPGAVVDRDDVAELIQYAPSTTTVRPRPLLIVPPPIGRYYFLDLRPGRSFVEYAVSRGLQVFLLSWRNPSRKQRDWDIDTYAGRVLAAVDVVTRITRSPDVSTLGFCAGGLIQSAVLSHLAAAGDTRVAHASFAVTLLDFHTPAPLGAFMSPSLLRVAGVLSGTRGVLDAKALGAVFSWMRPDDLVTNYWVSRYLMGERPQSFDILAWNADGTNLPAGLHRDFLRILRTNGLATPGSTTVLGTPVDLGKVTVPTFVAGAVADHITPWQGCYRTTQLMSGPATFVLSNAGHIASLVNPPGGKKASYWTGGAPGPDPLAWQASALEQTGSWWEAWADWTLERSGDEVEAPPALGDEFSGPLTPAPGQYVLAPAG